MTQQRLTDLDGVTVNNDTAWIHHAAGKLRLDAPPVPATGNYNAEAACTPGPASAV